MDAGYKLYLSKFGSLFRIDETGAKVSDVLNAYPQYASLSQIADLPDFTAPRDWMQLQVPICGIPYEGCITFYVSEIEDGWHCLKLDLMKNSMATSPSALLNAARELIAKTKYHFSEIPDYPTGIDVVNATQSPSGVLHAKFAIKFVATGQTDHFLSVALNGKHLWFRTHDKAPSFRTYDAAQDAIMEAVISTEALLKWFKSSEA